MLYFCRLICTHILPDLCLKSIMHNILLITLFVYMYMDNLLAELGSGAHRDKDNSTYSNNQPTEL